MILLLSEELDESTNHVMDWLIAEKENVIRANAYDLKVESIDVNQNTIVLRYKDDVIDANKVTSIWYRRGNINYEYPNIVTNNQKLIQHIDNHLYEEWIEVIRFLVKWFKKNTTIPFIGEYGGLDRKLDQLECAKKAGLLIPNTFITSNKKDLISFYRKSNYAIITKGIASSASYTYDTISLEGYTEKVTQEFINKLPDTFFPSLFQENIKKAYELRIFFLKDVFYPMAIFSQNNEQTKVDMRKYDDTIPSRTVPYMLPKNIKEKLLETMNALKLTTGSIDMIVDNDEKYYFLEVNPSGQFGMVSVPCNYNIEKAIAQELI